MAARLTTFSNGSYTFDVLDEGPLDGAVVVLLHGFPQTATSWAKVVPQLHALGFRTVAPTQRGYSPGARPRGRFAYRMSALVGDVRALIEALDSGPVHLVGHDWGAAVGWAVSARHPEMVRSFTSVSVPHPLAFLRSMLTTTQVLRSWYMLAFQVPWLPEWLLGMTAQLRKGLTRAGLSAEQVEHVVAEVAATGGMRGAVNWYRAMFIAGPKSLLTVRVPTTHVWSTRDRFVTRRSAELAARYVRGPYELEVLDASHWIPDERPAELAAIIATRSAAARV